MAKVMYDEKVVRVPQPKKNLSSVIVASKDSSSYKQYSSNNSKNSKRRVK